VSDPKKVFIFGYSGHAYVVIESLIDSGYQIAGYFDYKIAEKNPYSLKYFGFEAQVDVKKIVRNQLVFPTVGDNSIRERLIHLFDELGLIQFTVIDPSAYVSKSAQIGNSTYIGKSVSINAQSEIGRGVIINTQAIIEHECVVGDYAHIAPNAVLCGNVSIGKKSFAGANSVIVQNSVISSDVIIGAGGVAIKSIQEKGVYVGSPVRKL
jgi:sugar O-acyltransferase (sialic acid O-acetyltransferase NeuD family)